MTLTEYKKQKLQNVKEELEYMKKLKKYIDGVGKEYAYAVLEGHISGLKQILKGVYDEKAS